MGVYQTLDPRAKSGNRKRQTDMGLKVNAIFFIDRTGCQWRYLPRFKCEEKTGCRLAFMFAASILFTRTP
jgi:transposase